MKNHKSNIRNNCEYVYMVKNYVPILMMDVYK